MAPGRTVTVRIHGLPGSVASAEAIIDEFLNTNTTNSADCTSTVLPACDCNDELMALIDFPDELPVILSHLNGNPHASCQITVQGEELTIDKHFVGMTQLSPPSSHIVGDLVFICGLDGHAYGSWQGRGTSDAPPRMWPRHFLPRDFPHTRIMSFGYSNKLAREDHATIDDYARELIDGLLRVRGEEARNRPLVLIAHSFGGIVVARALIKARNERVNETRLASLLNSLIGLMFFAVPHRGIDIEDMSRIMNTQEHPRKRLLQHINVDSELLVSQIVDLKNILYDHKIVSFFETGRTCRLERTTSGEWKRTGNPSLSLPRESATLGLPEQIEKTIYIDADHSAIIKFNNKYDKGYRDFTYYLKGFFNSKGIQAGPGSFYQAREVSAIDWFPQNTVSWTIVALGALTLIITYSYRSKLILRRT